MKDPLAGTTVVNATCVVTINISIKKDVSSDNRSCISLYGQTTTTQWPISWESCLENQPQGSLYVISHL
jgi:hypothetical protein